MRKIFLLFGLLFCSLQLAIGQEAGIFRLSLAGEHVRFSDRSITSLGLDLDVFVSDNLSLSYRYAIGINSRDEFYAHIPVGAWLASFPLTAYSQTSSDILIAASIFCLLIPESINAHIWLGDNVRLSPFVAPLGMFYENITDRPNPPFQAGFSGGLKAYFFTKKFSLMPYLGVRSLYARGSSWGLLAGASLGIKL